MMNSVDLRTHRPAAQPFFRTLDWSAFWTACLLTFAVYFYTLAPTVSLEDGGELAVAGDYLGVPHPPGYPIWTLLAWIFTKVFAFVTFRGQPNPSWCIALLSAVCGALASGATAMLICRSGADILRQSMVDRFHHKRQVEDLISWMGGVIGSLLFAFSPVMWSQSVIVEVYSLNALFLMALFLFSYRWMHQPSDRLLYVIGFVFGLGLTNYQVLLLAAMPLVVLIMLRDTELFRDFVIAGLPFMFVIFLIKGGHIPTISHPLAASGFVYMLLNVAALVLAFMLLPRGRTVAITLLLIELGIAFYGFMPIVSDLRNPPMNWGYPRTWEGFLHAISRGQYEKIMPTDVFSHLFIDQIGAYFTDLRLQFTLPLAMLGFLPFTLWEITFGKRRFKALHLAIVLTVLVSVIVFVDKSLLPGADNLVQVADVGLYKLLAACVLALVVVGGAVLFMNQGAELVATASGKTERTMTERVTAIIILTGAALAYVFVVVMLVSRIGHVTAALDGIAPDQRGAMVGRVFLQVLGLLLLIFAPVLLIGAAALLRNSRFQLRPVTDSNAQKWIIATLFGFLVMSVMLIVLANPKGDIQDNFIQRVKFISSHGFYAIWIGYGAIFGLAFIDSLLSAHLDELPDRLRQRIAALNLQAAVPACCALVMVGAIAMPLIQNAFNKELIRTSGGAEQQNHDFGWQFGNYQLRGAEAISEELSPDEEPLPNPVYPPAMTPHAIFFGGTDPGRFVPTYMIYSARVREDVYLITQNALADNTYMAVMRDLYGDQIWIPAQPDSATAFQRYVEEVRSGKRNANAELKIENGRVQVSGALGVMEINGILCEMIFEENRYRHDFYVEESYVIPWMYGYMEPHGLIMKINRDPLPGLNDVVTENDLEFWDWYTRRLTGDRKFIRDVVARKSFSKLRSAIAGLFAARGRIEESERAFNEARLLYPLSPEANFRLVNEVLMRVRRFTESRNVVAEFGRMDPGNTKVPEFLGQLENIIRMNARLTELEGKMPKLTIQEALEACMIYQRSGQLMPFLSIANNIVADGNLPIQFRLEAVRLMAEGRRYEEMDAALKQLQPQLPENTPAPVFLEIAKMYAQANKPADMLWALERYLKITPSDWRAWLDIAAVQVQVGRHHEAQRSLQQAVRFGGQEALEKIQQDPRFGPAAAQAALPATAPPGIGTFPGTGRSIPDRFLRP